MREKGEWDERESSRVGGRRVYGGENSIDFMCIIIMHYVEVFFGSNLTTDLK